MLRRTLLRSGGMLALAGLVPPVLTTTDARAQLSFRVGPGGQFQSLPIAVVDFAGEGDLGSRVSGIVTNNLKRSGYFAPVYTAITGIGGFFDTRVAFVDESGPKDNRRKRLAVMDQDGANVRYLTSGDNLVVTPRYSPATPDIAFMSQTIGQQPRVQVINLETGARQVVGNFPDMTSSPRFSPDGQRLVMSLQQGGNGNIYMMNLGSRTTTRVTSTGAIDTSPSFSPDGSQIVFESDRGGQQQIYVMGADGSNPRRISCGVGAYPHPGWAPGGDTIAFTKQKGGTFSIGVMKPDGSNERILAEGFHNEGPTWAPNGQYLMFFREGGGGGRLHMVDITGRVEQTVPTPSFASDPTWSPLLTEAR